MSSNFEPNPAFEGSLKLAIEAGLLDVSVFNEDGTINEVSGLNVLSLEPGKNIFESCPVFIGLENQIGEIVDAAEEHLVFSSINMPRGANEDALMCDVRVCRGSSRSEFVVVTTSSSSLNSITSRAIRNARNRSYEEEIAELERQRFEQYYSQNPVLCFACDHRDRPIAASKNLIDFANHSGENADDWITNFLKSRPGSDVAYYDDTDAPRLETAIRFDGAIRIIEAKSHSVANHLTGREENYFVLLDVTEREIALRTVSRQKKMLQHTSHQLKISNERLEEFAHVAAHDLVGPLGRISVFAELIERELSNELPDQIGFAIEAISKSASSCRTVVTDILESSLIDGIEPYHEVIDLKSLMNSVLIEIAGDAHDIGLEMTGRVRTIYADRKLSRAIFRNILSNSYKYRSPKRPLKITISAESLNDHNVTIGIEDNGSGFVNRGKSSAFDPFTRLNSGNPQEGTGLGLSIVKNACASLGWVATIQSQLDRGTVVNLENVRIGT